MKTWLDGRNTSAFQAIAYSNDVLSFRVAVGAGATALRGMVPATFAGKALTGMTRDGAPITFTRETIKGVDYAFFTASSGTYAASYAPDTTAPAISAVAAVAAADGTATVTWTTDEASDSRVDYGTVALDADPERVRRGGRHRPQRPPHRAHAGHDVPLPRALDATPPTTRRPLRPRRARRRRSRSR